MLPPTIVKLTARGFPFRAAVACISGAFLLAVVATTRAQTYSFSGLGAENPSDVILSGSTLYGTTALGGLFNNGMVYLISTNLTGGCALHSFVGGNDDGGNPRGPLILSGSTLYGTTISGGNSYLDGTLFSLTATTNCPGTNYDIVFSFLPWEAQNPYGSLVLSGTSLFGLTTSNKGTLFRINTDGTGCTNLYVFGGQVTNIVGPVTNVVADGAMPNSSLLLVGSTLYGTTSSGGMYTNGTVFQINTDGSGYSILHHFANTPDDDGSAPQSGLVLSGSTLYGTTSEASHSYGTVYEVSTNGTGFQTLYGFGLLAGDGYAPFGPLTLSNSTLYGTTSLGGSNACDCGTIFQINTDGSGYQVLYSFFGSGYGGNPQGSLILSGPTLYGVAGGVFSFAVPALSPQPPPTSSVLRITSIVQQGSDVVISWTNSIGSTNALQGTTNSVQGTASSDYGTNYFADIFTNIAIFATTNYTDSGALTNYSSRYYRVRSLP